MNPTDTPTDPEQDPDAPEDWYDGSDLYAWGHPTASYSHFDTREEDRGER